MNSIVTDTDRARWAEHARITTVLQGLPALDATLASRARRIDALLDAGLPRDVVAALLDEAAREVNERLWQSGVRADAAVIAAHARTERDLLVEAGASVADGSALLGSLDEEHTVAKGDEVLR